MFIARGVGVIVAIAALVLLILLLMFSKAIVAYLISKWGISGLTIIVCFVVWGILKLANIQYSVFYRILTRSCY